MWRPDQFVEQIDQDQVAFQFFAIREGQGDGWRWTWVAAGVCALTTTRYEWGLGLTALVSAFAAWWSMDLVIPRRHRLEVVGQRIRLDGVDASTLVIEEKRVVVDGVAHRVDGRLTVRAMQLLSDAIRHARELQRAREGGAVPEELDRVVRAHTGCDRL